MQSSQFFLEATELNYIVCVVYCSCFRTLQILMAILSYADLMVLTRSRPYSTQWLGENTNSLDKVRKPIQSQPIQKQNLLQTNSKSNQNPRIKCTEAVCDLVSKYTELDQLQVLTSLSTVLSHFLKQSQQVVGAKPDMLQMCLVIVRIFPSTRTEWRMNLNEIEDNYAILARDKRNLFYNTVTYHTSLSPSHKPLCLFFPSELFLPVWPDEKIIWRLKVREI